LFCNLSQLKSDTHFWTYLHTLLFRRIIGLSIGNTEHGSGSFSEPAYMYLLDTRESNSYTDTTALIYEEVEIARICANKSWDVSNERCVSAHSTYVQSTEDEFHTFTVSPRYVSWKSVQESNKTELYGWLEHFWKFDKGLKACYVESGGNV